MLTFYNSIYRENRGDQIRKGRPKPLADLLVDLDRGDQICRGLNLRRHWTGGQCQCFIVA